MHTSKSAGPTSPASPAGPEAAGAGPSAVRVWWLAARPATLAASVAPVLAGTAVAVHDGRVRTLPGLGALVVAVAIQVGTNYANDYSDFVRGADRRRVGPLRAASSGVVRPGHVRCAAVAAFGVAAVVGLAVSVVTSPALALLGALAVAAGWLYTGGPRPYGYAGLGELFVFVFFGLLATAGTAYVHELRVPPAAWAAGCATGAVACAILALNNLRDREGDAQAGKRTLAVRLGAGPTRAMIAAFLAVPLASPLVAIAAGWAPAWTALTLLSAPLAFAAVRASASTTPPVLVAGLKRAAEMELCWALLWTLGLLL
ncbi:MAG TPA: 1,4-dihydroxy-2-naphthoate polyprenyltransferase [Candidatus Dormibacteraeota bacterium]|nr:1,4-dihydroxy-2-naphthoate polyprenyltransferase [Candidatus Dormibacteraeota bacterium]